ncbi:MAG: hypothetical protein FWG85_01320 [Bacteroidetes bacterium]|nr:hypothetical protein [Bacteroidota bacterium]
MTIESSHLQKPTAAPNNPQMSVQNEIQKGLEKETSPNAAVNSTKQVLAASQVPQQQNPQRVVSEQIARGYLDIKI